MRQLRDALDHALEATVEKGNRDEIDTPHRFRR